MDIAPDGTRIERLGYHHENGADAWFIRGYHPERREYQMIDSHFDPEFPRWIREAAVPLVPGKGVPTALYMEIVLWKKLKVPANELRQITIQRVHDWESVFHLHALFRKTPAKPLGEHFRETRLFHSRNNLVIQTDLEVTALHVNTAGATFSSPQQLAGNAPGALFEDIVALAAKYGIDHHDMVLWGFNVEMKVQPI
ncbi:MAG: hypothetical protein AAGN35_05310 [Bacteroidota bacterium]